MIFEGKNCENLLFDIKETLVISEKNSIFAEILKQV